MYPLPNAAFLTCGILYNSQNALSKTIHTHNADILYVTNSNLLSSVENISQKHSSSAIEESSETGTLPRKSNSPRLVSAISECSNSNARSLRDELSIANISSSPERPANSFPNSRSMRFSNSTLTNRSLQTDLNSAGRPRPQPSKGNLLPPIKWHAAKNFFDSPGSQIIKTSRSGKKTVFLPSTNLCFLSTRLLIHVSRER